MSFQVSATVGMLGGTPAKGLLKAGRLVEALKALPAQVRVETFLGLGLGLRMSATDAGKHPLLETREIVFDGD